MSVNHSFISLYLWEKKNVSWWNYIQTDSVVFQPKLLVTLFQFQSRKSHFTYQGWIQDFHVGGGGGQKLYVRALTSFKVPSGWGPGLS